MKKFTAIILVFCMLAATLVTGLSVFAAQDAGTGSETQKLESVDKPTAFVQFKETENANTYDTRVVVAAPQTTMDACDSASLVVSFVTAEDTTVSSTPRSVTGIYRNVNAGDDTYTAGEGNVLFGVVVTGVPYGTKSVSATLTATTGEEEETIDLGGSDKMPEKVYTVSELLELDEVKNLDAELYTAQKYTAKGKVTSIGATDKTGSNGQKYYQNVTISDGEKSILIYSINFVEGVTSSFKKGDTITVKGYIQNYKDKDGNLTIEFSGKDGDYPLCLAVEEGEPDATVPTKGTFIKVTEQSQITEGYYLFVYYVVNQDGTITQAVMDSNITDKANTVKDRAVVIDDDRIYFEEGGKYWVHLASCGNGYSIQLPGGLYLQGTTASENGLFTSSEPVEHSFTLDPKNMTVAIQDTTKESTTARSHLKYNTSSPRFNYYTGGQKDFWLYKLDKDATDYTTHTVTFMNGSDTYETQTVVEGHIATEPTAPTKTGHTFKGWFTDDVTFEDKFNFETPIMEDVTVYAKWEKVEVAPTTDKEVTFKLADDKTAFAEGTGSQIEYSETVDGYTLSITGSKISTGAADSKGNGCLKLGTNGDKGSITFTVDSSVTTVKIYVTNYKAKTSSVKVTVGGSSITYSLTKSSDKGEYDVIEIDTSTNKTVKLESGASGDKRCMINTIVWVIKGDN